MRIIVIGAGIGGLTTALALEAAGITDVIVFEAAPEMLPLGVGINLLPHAVRELTELGLGEHLERMGVATSALRYANRHGQTIWTEPRGQAAGYNWPQYSVHRGELQMLLRDTVLQRLGPDAIQLGARAESMHGEDGRASVSITWADGTRTRESADVIVAADGIHSAVRRQRYPHEGPPVWNGLILWRGTARVEPYLDGRTMIIAGDAMQKFVAYPLALPAADGLATINFIAEYRSDAAEPGLSSWNRSADPAVVLDRFAQWSFDWLDVRSIIGAADQILEYPMVDRDPVPEWTFGAQTLLGDAAHAMYPIGSNGASQAIIDARTLAHHLATQRSIPAALHSYEQVRRPRTTALTLSNRSMGPELVMQLAYERAPEGFDDIDEVIPYEERAEIAARYKLAAGFHPEELNAQPSLSVVREQSR